MMNSKRLKLAKDQKEFLHGHNIGLENFAKGLFGNKYEKCANRVDIIFWKKFYISTLEVLDASIFQSIGSVDEPHKQDIKREIRRSLELVRNLKAKDEIHSVLILGLLRLVFLLLGRSPYYARGKSRSFSTFRTLTYSQTEEQLSWLLQGYIQRHPKRHGFDDHFDADFAFLNWCRENKFQQSDRSRYVEWVRQKFPNTYQDFR